MIRFTRIAVIPVFIVLLLTVHASAEYTTNRAEFLNTYQGLNVQMFSGTNAAPGDGIFCSGPLDQGTNNACLGPNVIQPGIVFNSSQIGPSSMLAAGPLVNGYANPINTLGVGEGDSSLIISFPDNAVNVVGLNIGCYEKGGPPCASRSLTVESIGLGNVVVGSIEITASDSFNSFVGIARPDLIAAVVITPTVLGDGVSPSVDAVYFGRPARNVPTMSEWGLLATIAGLGIIGFIVVRRRKMALN